MYTKDVIELITIAVDEFFWSFPDIIVTAEFVVISQYKQANEN